MTALTELLVTVPTQRPLRVGVDLVESPQAAKTVASTSTSERREWRIVTCSEGTVRPVT